jgi:hypothetical protein
MGRNPRPRSRSRAPRWRRPVRAFSSSGATSLLFRSAGHRRHGRNPDRSFLHSRTRRPSYLPPQRNFGSTEAVFLSTRLVEDRFGLAFEFFINVAHNFVETAGVPESFSALAWSQAEAQVRGETSQDAWEARRRAQDIQPDQGRKAIDERARTAYFDSAFSDALAIYMLSLAVDFDYHDLRERDYPLLAAPALAERLRHVAALFPANPGYEFQILYRRKG